MTQLNYDASGFIIGVGQMKRGIQDVHKDTQNIVKLLQDHKQSESARLSELTRSVKAATHRLGGLRESSASSGQDRRNGLQNGQNNRAGARENRITSSSNHLRSRTSNQSSRINGQPINRERINNTDGQNRTIDRRSLADRTQNPSAARERDANGRFTSSSDKPSSMAGRVGSGLGAIGHAGLNMSSSGGVDPLMDGLKEAKDLLSPLGRGAKLAGRATKFSLSKFKSLKRREPLPIDQDRHNNENEKLLDKIWKAIRKQNGNGGGGGLLGSLLGGGRRRRGGGLLKKLGGIKAIGLIGTAIGAAGLAGDWGSLDHKGKSEGVGGLAGGAAGAAAGMAIGSVIPVVGTTIGAVVGGYLGYKGGEVIGGAASPHIQSWTNSLAAYNLPKKMNETWDSGIKPFFTRLDGIAGRINTWIENKARNIGDGVNSFFEGGTDGITSKNSGANGASAANLDKKRQDNQMMVYKSFRNAGLSDAQSRAMTAEVGRENGYQDKYLFGGHNDPANNAYNLGMFSWQKDRGKKLYGHLNSKGLIKNGKIVQSQEALNEQAKFSVNEINNNKTYSRTKREFLDNPNVSYQQASEVLGNNYIRWRHNDPKYAKHHKYRDQYKALIDKQLKPVEDTTVIDEAKGAAKKAGAVIKNAVAPAVTNKPASTSKTRDGILGFSTSEVTKSINNKADLSTSPPMIFKESLGPTGVQMPDYASAGLPAVPLLKIPSAPQVSQRLDSGGNKPIIVQSGSDTINQNVSDRDLAHAITGGLGQSRYY